MLMDRRRFLAAGLAPPLLAVTRQAAAQTFDRGFARVTRIADGVWATIADPRQGQQCYSNGGVIAGRDAVLIVEGHFQPEGAALEIEVARTASKAPIRGVVNTHYHLDHTFGNVGYARQGIAILAHERSGPLMKQGYVRMSESDRRARLAPLEQRLSQAASTVDRDRKARDLEVMTWIVDSINNASLALPTEPLATADLPKRIDLGGLTAVIEFHPGHSPTDLVIRVPERDVVFAGDLFFSRAYPVVADSDILAWRRVVDTLAGYGRQTQVVPGHGALGSIEQVRQQAAVMDDLRAHADSMMRAGASIDEAERRYVVPKAFSGFEILSWNFTVGGAMRTYYSARQ